MYHLKNRHPLTWFHLIHHFNLIDVPQNIICFPKCNILPCSKNRQFEKTLIRYTPLIDLCSLFVPIPFSLSKNRPNPWVADASSLACCVGFWSPLFLVVLAFGLHYFCVVFWFGLVWIKSPKGHEELIHHACLFLGCWECYLSESGWRFSKWEINDKDTYLTCAVGKTWEGNSFWWLWL